MLLSLSVALLVADVDSVKADREAVQHPVFLINADPISHVNKSIFTAGCEPV